MTQKELDLAVQCILLARDESIGDYELVVTDLESMPITYKIQVRHDEIRKITLPSNYVRKVHREIEKAIVDLIDKIIEHGQEWLQQEEDYWQDKKENEEENNWESKRDYKND